MSHPVFLGRVERGEVILDDGGKVLPFRSPEVEEWIGKLEGQVVEVQISALVPKHSDEARAYYFGVVVKRGAQHLGYTSEEMHRAFECALLIDSSHEPARIGTIKGMSRPAFYSYTEECRRLLAESGCDTPNPDPLWWKTEKER